MHRIDSAGTAVALPTPAAVGSTVGYWTRGNPQGGVPATVLDPDWLNAVQEELLGILTAAGVTPSKTTRNQVMTSLRTMYRTKLTANLTVYVATTGSDANTGLASGSAFATLQKAWDTIVAGYDLNGFSATIQVANGTYTAGISTNRAAIGGPVIVTGNVSTPSAVQINVTNGVAFYFDGAGFVFLSGMSIAASGTNALFSLKGSGVFAARNTYVGLTNIVWNGCPFAHMYATQGACISYTATAANQVPITIQGSAGTHAGADQGGFISMTGGNVTLSGTPAFANGFATCGFGGLVAVQATIFTGAATGLRYSVSSNGVIFTNGAGASYLPGDQAGFTGTGGQYT